MSSISYAPPVSYFGSVLAPAPCTCSGLDSSALWRGNICELYVLSGPLVCPPPRRVKLPLPRMARDSCWGSSSSSELDLSGLPSAARMLSMETAGTTRLCEDFDVMWCCLEYEAVPWLLWTELMRLGLLSGSGGGGSYDGERSACDFDFATC
jgi:hypothetical protein